MGLDIASFPSLSTPGIPRNLGAGTESKYQNKRCSLLSYLRKFQRMEALRARSGAEPTATFSVISQGEVCVWVIVTGLSVTAWTRELGQCGLFRRVLPDRLVPEGDFPLQGPPVLGARTLGQRPHH